MIDERIYIIRDGFRAAQKNNKPTSTSPFEAGMVADAIEQLSAELEQVKRERDAAVDDINRILRLHVDERHPCEFCKNSGGSIYPECEYVDMDMCPIAEWRGLSKENGGKDYG